MNGVNIALGYALASYMGMAFYFAEDDTAKWRGPLGIALLWPIMMIAIVFVVPESPRYLLMKGKVEEARAIVMRLHSVKNDPDQEFARAEFYQMQKQTEWVSFEDFLAMSSGGGILLTQNIGQNPGPWVDCYVHQEGLSSPHSSGHGFCIRGSEHWRARCEQLRPNALRNQMQQEAAA